MEKQRIIDLLSIKNGSKEYFDLLHHAYAMSQISYKGKGYVFVQIGLNAEPCSANCKFCTFGKDHYCAQGTNKKTKEEIQEEVKALVKEPIEALFLMTTADYPMSEFLQVATLVRGLMPKEMKLVANIGDFNENAALELKQVGVDGVYHICRLGEGVDTQIPLEVRIKTIEGAQNAGLDLYYCIEPIGPEHTYEQIADEILRAIAYGVEVMAVMRRVPVQGTPLFKKGMIDLMEFTKIAAVTRILVDPKKSMNAHETNPMSLLAGINQLYAEVGSNPRDAELETTKSRGLSVMDCFGLLKDGGYTI